jgi:hypothetical protein
MSAADQLLARLADPGAGPLSPIDLLAYAAPDDEQVQAVCAALRQREAAARATEEEAAGQSAIIRPGQNLADIAEIADGAEILMREVEVLRRRNDELAAALGACYLCWGEDIECPACDGTGKPGSAPPDPAAYRRLVSPVAGPLLRRAGGRPAGPRTQITSTTDSGHERSAST